MTPTGLAQLFKHVNYLWGDPVEPDNELARDWYRALEPVDDDAVMEALPLLAQKIDRRPSIAQLVQQARAVVASRPSPPALPEGQRVTPYGRVWMRIMRAWREDRLEASKFQQLAARHALYFGSGNSSAAPQMVEESEAILKEIHQRGKV